MKRNLEQLANYLVENGAFLSREQYYIQNYIAYTPCAKMHEIRRQFSQEAIAKEGIDFLKIYAFCIGHEIPLHNVDLLMPNCSIACTAVSSPLFHLFTTDSNPG